MIWYFILSGILSFVDTVFAIIASAFNFQQNPELPFGLDGLLTTGVGYYRALADVFPPFTVILQVFIFYLSFRILLFVLKVFRVLPNF